jgi:ribosomal protein S18 acetylase RimI-like enzyme
MPSHDVTTRPAGPDDAPFLLEVFAESNDVRSWLAAADRQLLNLQFTAQQAGYAAQFPGAVHDIILVDGERAGQVLWIDLGHEVRVVDIALLSRYRRHGAAAAVYRTILAHARARGTPVRASVERLNAVSLAFHQRLGFVVERENETHFDVAAFG